MGTPRLASDSRPGVSVRTPGPLDEGAEEVDPVGGGHLLDELRGEPRILRTIREQGDVGERDLRALRRGVEGGSGQRKELIRGGRPGRGRPRFGGSCGRTLAERRGIRENLKETVRQRQPLPGLDLAECGLNPARQVRGEDVRCVGSVDRGTDRAQLRRREQFGKFGVDEALIEAGE